MWIFFPILIIFERKNVYVYFNQMYPFLKKEKVEIKFIQYVESDKKKRIFICNFFQNSINSNN